jgi:hypothetical protein
MTPFIFGDNPSRSRIRARRRESQSPREAKTGFGLSMLTVFCWRRVDRGRATSNHWRRSRALMVLALCVGAVAGTASAGLATAGAVTQDPWTPAPPNVVEKVTHIPKAVFDDVMLQPTVTPPVVLHHHSPLTFDAKPGVFYMGAEPCPLCAAERWAVIVALSRFGKWSDLGITQSASNDIDPSTQSFTFSRAKYTSPYIALRTVEHLSSQELPNKQYAVLQQPTREETKLFATLTSAKYFPANSGTYPFVDVGNRVVMSSASFDPDVLQALSRDQIADDLSNATSPVTKAIVATANYFTAAVCLIDGGAPRAVCKSPRVLQSGRFDQIDNQHRGVCAPKPEFQPACSATAPSRPGS